MNVKQDCVVMTVSFAMVHNNSMQIHLLGQLLV